MSDKKDEKKRKKHEKRPPFRFTERPLPIPKKKPKPRVSAATSLSQQSSTKETSTHILTSKYAAVDQHKDAHLNVDENPRGGFGTVHTDKLNAANELANTWVSQHNKPVTHANKHHHVDKSEPRSTSIVSGLHHQSETEHPAPAHAHRETKTEHPQSHARHEPKHEHQTQPSLSKARQEPKIEQPTAPPPPPTQAHHEPKHEHQPQPPLSKTRQEPKTEQPPAPPPPPTQAHHEPKPKPTPRQPVEIIMPAKKSLALDPTKSTMDKGLRGLDRFRAVNRLASNVTLATKKNPPPLETIDHEMEQLQPAVVQQHEPTSEAQEAPTETRPYTPQTPIAHEWHDHLPQVTIRPPRPTVKPKFSIMNEEADEAILGGTEDPMDAFLHKQKDTLNEVARKAQEALQALQMHRKQSQKATNIEELEKKKDRLQINKVYHLTDEGKDLLAEVRRRRAAPYMDYMTAPWIPLEDTKKRERNRKFNVRTYYTVMGLNLFITLVKIIQIWHNDWTAQWLQVEAGDYNCPQVIQPIGVEFSKFILVLHLVWTTAMLFPMTKDISITCLAYIFLQTCETSVEALAYFYHLFWNYQEYGVQFFKLLQFFGLMASALLSF